ncbi:MAG: low molecular weight phosphotyrosine protein phosphatase [Chlorobia bacterium]|nr:low molecular weight phosphotyrosine protein phosphatase [Fimbriimonadaceae bacterium]
MTRVLFVCLGNICRSPLAEGIFRKMAAERGISIETDSAGTGDYHIGELADHRALSTGTKRGCDMTMRARQFQSSDFQEFDLIVVMDHQNRSNVQKWSGAVPEKIRLARSFDQDAIDEIVPDPYYGNLRDFEEVADMLESACAGILNEIAKTKSLQSES